MKKQYLILIMILVFVSSVYADYNETGNFNSFFQAGTGFFNTELTTIDSFTRTIGTQKNNPLVSDLDGDGINEIIILDDVTFRLYQNKELDIIDAYTLPHSTLWSNFIAFDIDDDGFTELIIASELEEEIYILEYNGTVFKNQTMISISSISHNDGEMLIKCGEAEKCLLATSFRKNALISSRSNLTIIPFNSTSNGTLVLDQADSSVSSTFCFPKIRTMSYTDYDNDGNKEFIFSASEVVGVADEDVNIYYIDVTDNVASIEQIIEETRTGNILSGTPLGCDNNIEEQYGFFTSPLVFDIDGSSSNGLETVIGGMENINEFRMYSYNSDGSNLDDYPEIFQADGIIISNIMRANSFDDSSLSTGFCVMGYDATDQELDLLCASEQETQTFLFIDYESVEFILDISNLYNITSSYGSDNVLTHSGQHSTLTTSGVNLDEIISSYGIIKLDWDNTCRTQIPPIRCLDLIFENPKGDSVLISVDTEKVGRDDLIVLTDSNLWYLDDKFVNSPAQIDEYFINPCLDSTWQLNTTSEVRITPIDIDNDLVSARAILYYNDDNEQDSNWSINVSSGTTISFGDFQANKTIAIGTLRLMARDVENPNTEDIIDLTFSVAPSGVVFGECFTDVSGIVEEAEVEAERELNETTTVRDNRLVDTVENISNLVGIPIILFLLILMFGVDLTLVTALHRVPFLALASIILFDFFLILITAIMGLMGTAFLISLFAVIIIAGAFFITFSYNKITSGG